MKKQRIFLDQYGTTIYARTIKELREKSYGGRVSKMYIDTKEGKTKHIGYVIGKHWYNEYQLVEREA